MYLFTLSLHSTVRWFVVISMVVATTRAHYGWIAKKEFSKIDNTIRHWTATIAHIQLTVGVVLYFVSPIIEYFLNNYSEAAGQREIRFFGMEHSVMMIAAVTIITIGSMKSKRVESDNQKFKTMAIWFSIGLLLILAMIPWPFSPMAARPLIR